MAPGNVEKRAGSRPLLSVVTAAYGEEQNLPALYERLRCVLEAMDVDWEWIVVDDHSPDDTFGAIQSLARGDPRIRGVRFSRNFGSHMAMVCGLARARGDCAVILSADLQDPPETIPHLLAKWHEGAEVVWAQRRRRSDDRTHAVLSVRLYYFIMRRVVGIKEMPSTGADFFLIGRSAVDALCRSHEGNVSILGLITWMGFSQASVQYDRQPRLHGTSGWSLEKKLKLVADSITAFSYLPIRVMSLLGVLSAVCGFALALWTVVVRVFGLVSPPVGYAALMTVLLLGFGFVMTFLGILGEYLWRTFDAVRGRPRFIIEQTVNFRTADPAGRNPRPGDDDSASDRGAPQTCASLAG